MFGHYFLSVTLTEFKYFGVNHVPNIQLLSILKTREINISAAYCQSSTFSTWIFTCSFLNYPIRSVNALLKHSNSNDRVFIQEQLWIQAQFEIANITWQTFSMYFHQNHSPFLVEWLHIVFEITRSHMLKTAGRYWFSKA